MPKKPNFLGGNQNYDEKNGQYLPNLVGSNGQVVKDADGDGKSHESWEKDFSPEEVKKMKNEYSGKEEHIKKLKDAGFRVDEGYKAGNTYKIDGKNFGDEASISIGEDGKYFRVTTNGGSYTYKDLDTAIDRAKYISGKAPSEDAVGWETGSYDAKTEQEFLMGKSKEQDFNLPDNYDEINEALADYQYEITDKTTVGDYAQRIAEKTGSSKEQVLSVLKKSSGKEFKETDKMSFVADLEEEQDFNDPSEAAYNKAEEKDFSNKVQSKSELEIKKTPYTYKNGSTKEIEYVDEAPKGWRKIEEATTNPNGYSLYTNGESLFNGKRETVLVKDKESSSKPYELVTPDTKINNDDMVIYKENGKYKMTNGKNWSSNVRNGNEIQDLSSFDNADDIVDYMKKYGGQGKNFKVVQDYYNVGGRELSKEEKEYVDKVSSALKDSKQEVKYPKGTSKEYTQKINKQFDESYKTLKEKYGFTDEQLKSDKVSETLSGVHQLFDNSQFYGGKSKWSKEQLKEIADALDVLDDKYYNDYYIRLAPRGY